jgi:hypothetical protein
MINCGRIRCDLRGLTSTLTPPGSHHWAGFWAPFSVEIAAKQCEIGGICWAELALALKQRDGELQTRRQDILHLDHDETVNG